MRVRMRRLRSPGAWVVLLAALAVVIPGCSRAMRNTVQTPGAPPPRASLWEEPRDLESRDLFYGVGGAALAPRDTTFTFVAEDTSGYSAGFDVRDANGVAWSVKLGPEAQSEVTSSRVLWAIGYHQPPTYYVPAWSLTGERQGPQPPGRFRAELPGEKVVGEWSWYENPFVGTTEFGGLIVANLILTNWDWKTSNNKIYVSEESADGRRRYVVRDLGASLGKFTYPTLLHWFRLRGFGQGTRNDLAGFEEQGFIKAVEEDDVEFHYRGIYRDVVDSVTPADVAWACALLARLTDVQWRDAFRAGGYDDTETSRFVAKIKAKIEEGLRLTAEAAIQSAGRGRIANDVTRDAAGTGDRMGAVPSIRARTLRSAA